MSDIAFSVIVNNNGIDDIVFKTIMLKGDKGNSVDHVEKTSTSGLVDTYTIYLTDGTIGGTFTVTNGSPVNIDDSVTAIDKTWSSSKLSGMIKSIDDNVVNADKLWSSQKINSMLAQTGTIEDVAMASFSDGADDLPLSELTVDIDAWQEGSGEPSPDNERAIHGWNECNLTRCGVNLLELIDGTYSINGVTLVISNGKITANGTATQGGGRLTALSRIFTLPAGTYFINSFNVGAEIAPYLNNADNNVAINSGDNRTFTLSNDTRVFFGVNFTSGNTYNNAEITPMVNKGNTASEYHSYMGDTATIEFGQTIFGGKLNILTGLMTVTRGIIDLSTIEWVSENETLQGLFRSVKTSTSFLNNAKYSSNILCDRYLAVAPRSCSGFDDKTIGYSNNNNPIMLRARDTDFSDASLFTASLANSQFVYEYETPIEIQLTPTEVRTLLNANNIYADTGNVDKIVYFKTGSEAVAKLIEAYMRAQPEE